MEAVQTTLEGEDLEDYLNADRDEKAKIVTKIFDGLEEDEKGQLLGGFCIEDDRETYNKDPYVMDCDSDEELSGTINAAFTGSAYYGCKDMDKLFEYDETVWYEVDPVAGIITFKTDPPEPPEPRYPDDEF